MMAKDQLDKAWSPGRTVDTREIERFDALAEEWWNPDGRFRPIHQFNAARRDFVLDWIGRHYRRTPAGMRGLSGLDVLDVGCGAGLLCEPIAERGARVVGIDASARNIEIARRHAVESALAIEYRHCLAEHLLAAGRQFDVVLNTEVIEHVADQRQLMQDCSALLRPGGLAIVTTLNRTLRSFALAIVGAEYVLGWLPKGTHDWRRFVKPAELQEMLAPHGLRAAEVAGVVHNPLRRQWRLSRDTSVNYMLVAEKAH